MGVSDDGLGNLSIEQLVERARTEDEDYGPALALRARLDNWPTEDLFAAVVAGNPEDPDDPYEWVAIRVLRSRGSFEVFETAKALLGSSDPRQRSRALDVLCLLGAGLGSKGHPPKRPFVDECVAIAIRSLVDPDEEVVHSAAWLLCHEGTPQALNELIRLKDHRDPGVRLAVARGVAPDESSAQLQGVIELMEDTDDEVRNWATFNLGSLQRELDSEDITAALRKRLDDSFEEVRDEAIWGLAQRKEPECLKLLLHRLEQESWKAGDEDAANELLNLSSDASQAERCTRLRELIAALPRK